jgi:hypothetical protein
MAKGFPWLADSFALGLKQWLLLEAFLHLRYHLFIKASTSQKRIFDREYTIPASDHSVSERTLNETIGLGWSTLAQMTNFG